MRMLTLAQMEGGRGQLCIMWNRAGGMIMITPYRL